MKNILTALVLMLSAGNIQLASASYFSEQGKCSGITKDKRTIEFILYSDFDPCVRRLKFNSLIDIKVTYPNSSPPNLSEHYFISGKHSPRGAIGNEGSYTGTNGRRSLVEITALQIGKATIRGIDGEDERENIELECRLPQICYAACK